jgi:serine/threonine protein kinase
MDRLEQGQTFGDFAIQGLIASGGMGRVYAARHSLYQQPVALKVLHQQLHADETWRDRFNEEGLVGSTLKHPNILSAQELVFHEDRVALVLELVRGGQTLEKVVSREYPKGLPLPLALRLMRSILHGIEYLHTKTIIHGDIKPDNVLIDGNIRDAETWCPRVTDFGTVSLIANPVRIGGKAAVVATPRYASPEHMLGLDAIEERSDLYCLGLLLHFLLTGQHASHARTVQAAAEAVRQPVSHTLLVDQPEGLQVVFKKATSVDPEGRYESCRALAEELEGVRRNLGIATQFEDLNEDIATEVDEERRLPDLSLDGDATGVAEHQPHARLDEGLNQDGLRASEAPTVVRDGPRYTPEPTAARGFEPVSDPLPEPLPEPPPEPLESQRPRTPLAAPRLSDAPTAPPVHSSDDPAQFSPVGWATRVLPLLAVLGGGIGLFVLGAVIVASC